MDLVTLVLGTADPAQAAFAALIAGAGGVIVGAAITVAGYLAGAARQRVLDSQEATAKRAQILWEDAQQSRETLDALDRRIDALDSRTVKFAALRSAR